ncbi:hypothetical protein CEXT_604971 [Caerostris extrusa]|uniref:Uncharacterized protein n=1 Tax=Caerostris extrusa TaxID=172846 RepID=A0AAV4XCU8_CAEEX|nr:hypothetical protein CEXT_604971 [Caerostris extrusa]
MRIIVFFHDVYGLMRSCEPEACDLLFAVFNGIKNPLHCRFVSWVSAYAYIKTYALSSSPELPATVSAGKSHVPSDVSGDIQTFLIVINHPGLCNKWEVLRLNNDLPFA